MKVMLFVNWCDNKIVTEKDKGQELEELCEYQKNDSDVLESFLNWEKGVSIVDVFNLSEEEKQEFLADFHTYCMERAEEQFRDEYETVTVEI